MANFDKNRHSEKQLTPEQLTAIEWLVQGLNDSDVAEKVHCSRQSVNAWRHHHPRFRAVLNQRRRDVWDGATDRLGPLFLGADHA